ncbi:MAG: hypothetical protein AAFZ49_11770, partial [Cyanobacteria bacterium J06659_2]
MKYSLFKLSGGLLIAGLMVAGASMNSANVTTVASEVTERQTEDDLRSLSTRFENPQALASWQEFQVEGWEPKWEPPRVENGRLVLQPQSSGWFEDNTAGHLYQEVTGDFIVTTRIRVEGTQSPLPQRSFSLAGLFIREPRTMTAETWEPNQENWLFFSVGTASPAGRSQFEIKSTYDSLSTLKISEAQAGWMR